MIQRKRLLVLAAATAIFAGACGSSDSSSESAATTKAGETATTKAGETATSAAGGATVMDGKIKCTQQYKGKKVDLFSPIRDKDVADMEKAYKAFEDCTGVDVVWEGSAQFESDIKVRIDGGNAPDVINYPQPGLLALNAKAGKLKELPADMLAEANSFVSGWKELGTVDGKFYALPLGANAKSFVWYSPEMFTAKGYKVPATLDEMKALSDKIVADGGTPWCAGIESGAATGWVVTDWFEDFMLRVNGAATYDQWVNHTIKFNDPKVKAVADAVGSYLKNEKYVSNVKAIATTRFQDGGLPIADGKCYMHRQASFYVSNWAAGTTFGDTGKINVFYLPVAKAGDPKVMLGGGELNAASNDKPETLDTIRYLASKEYANTRAALGNWLSPRKDYDTGKIPDPFFRKFGDFLQKADVFRFDGSDLMPGQVGAGTFWKETTAWITGGSTDDMLSNIEKSWPAS